MTLAVDSLHAGYGPVRVLNGASLAVAPGEILALMGRNGAGKSTLLKAIMGLVRPDAGTSRLDATRLDTSPPTRSPATASPGSPRAAASSPSSPSPRTSRSG